MARGSSKEFLMPVAGEAHRPRRVLMIDDDEDDYTLARDLLAGFGAPPWILDWADGYDAGRELIRRQVHDAYLVDHRLGGRSGLDLVDHARRICSRRPVIMLTGYGSRELDIAAMQFGAAAFIDKSCLTGEVLDRTLRYALRQFRFVDTLRRRQEDLRSLATHDDLTGLLNRRGFMKAAGDLVHDAAHRDAPLSICLADLDGFKPVNDVLGHPAGDAVLAAFARLLEASFRAGDPIGRLGGDEFCIALPGTAPDDAAEIVDRVGREIEAQGWTGGAAPGMRVTATFGVAGLGPGTETIEALIESADAALYRGKADGGACVRTAAAT